MKITSEKLVQDLASIVDPFFAKQIIASYSDMMQRYHAGDWKPSELDGGQFTEAISRALYQIDTGVVTDWHLPGDVVKELRNNAIRHSLAFKDRDHFCQILQVTYKFRNHRGVAHISPTYTANHIDAMLVVANVKWMLAEFLRLSGWNKDHSQIALTIESITQLEHPLIHELDGKPLVLTTQLSAAEEILVLLLHSSNGRLTRSELKNAVRKDQSTISRAIYRLDEERKIRLNGAGDIIITPLGQKQVYEEILPKTSVPSGSI